MTSKTNTGGEFSAGISVEFEELTEAEFAGGVGAAYAPPERGVFRIIAARVAQLLADAPGVIETTQTSAATIRTPSGLVATNDAGDGRFFLIKNNGTGSITIDDHLGGGIGSISAGGDAILKHNENNTWRIAAISSVGDPERQIYTWRVRGPLNQNSDVDGLLPMLKDGTIREVWVTLPKSGSGTTNKTLIDILKHARPAAPVIDTPYEPTIAGSTIYTTAGNRPEITADGGDPRIVKATLPDITSILEGDALSIFIVNRAAGSSDLTVQVLVEH